MRSYLFLSFYEPSPGEEKEMWQIGLARLLQERGEPPLIISNNEVVLRLARQISLPVKSMRWQPNLELPSSLFLAIFYTWATWWVWGFQLIRFRLGKSKPEIGHWVLGEDKPVVVCWSRTDQLLATLPARLLGMTVAWGMSDVLPRRWYWHPWGWWWGTMSHLAKLFAPNRFLSHKLFAIIKRPVAVLSPLIDEEGVRLQPWRFRETAPEWTIALVNDLLFPWQTSLVLQALLEITELIPTARVVVLGQGHERKQLQWLVKTLYLGDRVSWVTPLPDAPAWFPHCQAVVVARLDEPVFSWTVARSQLAGIPVVASDNGVHQEYITSEESGLLFTKSNIESLAQALVQLANRPEHTQEMVKNAQILARKRHDPERVWQQWRRLIS